MKKFEPSDVFVSKVMKSIYAYEKKEQRELSFAQALMASRLVRYGMSAAGIVLGIINLIRLISTVFSPILCR
jgi:hypothetical protein